MPPRPVRPNFFLFFRVFRVNSYHFARRYSLTLVFFFVSFLRGFYLIEFLAFYLARV